MKHIEKYIGIAMLLFAIGFNLWIYRLEPTAKLDPNDNTFQFALVDRTNQIWDFAVKKCSSNYLTFGFCHLSLLVDHWVPNWAQGYNLPYYYSHIPQIIIVALWRLFHIGTLFQFYHVIIYLLLSLFPLFLFLALRIIGVSWISAGFGALIASQLSTDGLYGLDPASFIWRGYGLSSQLFAMVFLPIAIAYAVRGKVIPAILTLAATTAGHLGIGMIAFLSTAVILLGHLGNLGNLSNLKINLKKLLIIYGGVFLLLGYWIFPILLGGNYHNISVWDGIWKFDSFGYREVLKNLFNGDLFDFGRLPILTALAFVGFFAALQRMNQESGITPAPAGGARPGNYEKNEDHDSLFTIHNSYFPFSLLFIFWILLYFGRTTWGGLVDFIPGMSEFHLSRFIVGVHVAGLFLIPIGFSWMMDKLGMSISYIVDRKKTSSPHIPYTNPHIRLLITGIVLVILLPAIYGQTLRYSSHNDFLINRANENYAKDKSDIDALFTILNSQFTIRPGRIFAGRGGGWGKDFRIAETPIYIHLSTYGIPIILWLPETWSPNSDTEQYFSESNPAHYRLYNVRYVVTPTNLDKQYIQAFWKLVESGKNWKLYSVIPAQAGIGSGPTQTEIPDQVGNDNTFGYITTGNRPAIVSSSKTDYRSLIRLWMHSDFPSQGLYPELTFDTRYPKNTGLPNFRMLDEVTYKVPDDSLHNLFAEMPRYLGDLSLGNLRITSQKTQADMVFTASVEVPTGCTECLVILRQSFHPSWRATIDGKRAPTFAVFPFYTAVKLEIAGTHEVVFSYQPSRIKVLLFVLSLITLIILCFFQRRMRF